VVLGAVDEPNTSSWQFSPDARWLILNQEVGAYWTLVAQPAEGGSRQVLGAGVITWLDDRRALLEQQIPGPSMARTGTYLATFE
jgi:hypothetical protein